MTVANEADTRELLAGVSKKTVPGGAAAKRPGVDGAAAGGAERSKAATAAPLVQREQCSYPSRDVVRVTRRERFVRRQRSSEWLIRDARTSAGLPPVAEPGTRAGSAGWVQPLRPARCRWALGAEVGVHGGDGQTAHFSGTERCASIWACPTCAAVVRSERAREIDEAVQAWQERGGHLVFATFTLRHKREDPLALTLDVVLKGWRRMLAGDPWQGFQVRHGVHGYVRSVEVTLGENGWHPHVHALLFVEGEVSEAVTAAMQAWLYDRWARIVTRLGARLPSKEHGVDVKAADAQGRVVARYLAKVQDEGARAKIGMEVARFDLKRSRSAGGMMPFELLDADADDGAARRLWIEYVHATKGRRAITWSKGLRARLIKEPERTDQEVLDAVEASPLLFTVPRERWAKCQNAPTVLAGALDLVEAGQVEAARVLLGGVWSDGEALGRWVEAERKRLEREEQERQAEQLEREGEPEPPAPSPSGSVRLTLPGSEPAERWCSGCGESLACVGCGRPVAQLLHDQGRRSHVLCVTVERSEPCRR